MDNDLQKDRILTRVRAALKAPTEQPYPELRMVEPRTVFEHPPTESDGGLAVLFAERFLEAGGKFVFCENAKDMASQLAALLAAKKAQHLFAWEADIQEFITRNGIQGLETGEDLTTSDVGITTCECLVARTGSIVLSSRQASGRSLSIFPPVHIVLAHSSQIVFEVADALALLQQRYRNELPTMITLATGPSRTADIEKTLVTGAHGPKEVYVFVRD